MIGSAHVWSGFGGVGVRDDVLWGRDRFVGAWMEVGFGGSHIVNDFVDSVLLGIWWWCEGDGLGIWVGII